MRRLAFCGILAFAVMSLPASVAMAGAWSSPSGTAQDFSYTNGGDINGRFGDPEVIGNTMSFPYVTFQANSAANGVLATDGDTVSWDMQCNPGWAVTYVKVWAFGSYTLTGVGSNVDADMSVAISELQTPNRQWQDFLTSAPAFPLVSTVAHLSGAWYGIAERDLSGVTAPRPGQLLHVDMTALLQALASADGGGAEINTQYQEVRIEFIPEPATLALLAIAGLALIRRR